MANTEREREGPADSGQGLKSRTGSSRSAGWEANLPESLGVPEPRGSPARTPPGSQPTEPLNWQESSEPGRPRCCWQTHQQQGDLPFPGGCRDHSHTTEPVTESMSWPRCDLSGCHCAPHRFFFLQLPPASPFTHLDKNALLMR